MARITVEDCLQKIPNRFQLVLAATYRSRMLSQGHAPKIETKNKPGVTALREIAQGHIGIKVWVNQGDYLKTEGQSDAADAQAGQVPKKPKRPRKR